MRRLLAALALVAALPVAAAEPAPSSPPPSSAASSPPSSSSSATSSASTPSAAADEAPSAGDKHMKTDLGRVGIALLAGGAALATATASGVTLMQAVTHPDDDRTPQQNTEYIQVSGFVTVAIASVAAGLMIAGGAMVLDETIAAPPAPAPTTSGT